MDELIDEIASVLGPYVKLHQKELVSQFMQPGETTKYLTTIFSEVQDGNELGIPNYQLGEVVQSFQDDFTGKGQSTFSAEKVTQRRHKVDLPINPDKIVGEWTSYLYNEKVDRADMPLVQFIVNKIADKVVEDREEKMVYMGKRVAPTTGVAGHAIQTVDGFGVLITRAAAAGKFDPFAMGAITESNAFDYMEEFFATRLPRKHKFRRLDLFMNETIKLWYQKDKRNNFQWQQDMAKLLQIDFSKLNVIGLPSMEDLQTVFCTVPGNLVQVFHKNTGLNNLKLEEEKRKLFLMSDWHECYGIADFRYFWANDQDLDEALFGVAEESGS